jgi:lipopolysaccharide export LptBFGC system permease protein LptF
VAEGEYPIRMVALAVGGTITLCTLIVSQWILPTMTASLNHEIVVLKENVSKQREGNAALKQTNEKLSQTIEDQRRQNQQKLDAFSAENKELKDKLFSSRKANNFLLGDPYPIGLDKVRIGDSKNKIFDTYRSENIREVGRLINVKQGEEIFRDIQYRHSSSANSQGKVDSIQYHLGNMERLLDKTLTPVPENWLEQTLRKVLGEPFVVGLDNSCLLWKKSDKEVVYYILHSDWFEISGFVTYPPGCNVTKEQFGQQKPRAETPR